MELGNRQLNCFTRVAKASKRNAGFASILQTWYFMVRLSGRCLTAVQGDFYLAGLQRLQVPSGLLVAMRWGFLGWFFWLYPPVPQQKQSLG